MLKEQSRLLQQGLFLTDLLAISVAWALAWFIRFELFVPPAYESFSRYLGFLPAVLVIWGTVFLASGLYQPRRAERLPMITYAVARAVFLGIIASVAAMFFYREFYFSRLHMLLFGVFSSGFLVLLRLTIYVSLHQARKQGKNLRRVLIIGAGNTGRRLADALRHFPWMGYEVVGFLDDQPERKEGNLLGTPDDLGKVMDDFTANGQPIDFIYISLPVWEPATIEEIMDTASRRLAHVAFVPDLLHFEVMLNSRLTEVAGMPVIHLLDESPMAFQRMMKRVIDVAFSLAVLILLSPVYLILAIGVKLSSRGPVFYRQERMGLNGRTFDMLKFRSMPTNAEAKTGAVWAKPGEDRATPIGKFLRKTSLDELPQFINVLMGDMSVVGPRPERPVFIEQFKERVPHYMLRHKMKSGITGWAQINGWRGNTSIEKRIECDIFYIQNWSLSLDLKIMWLTVWKGFVNKNAY